MGEVDAGIAGSIFANLDYATVQGYDFYGAWQPQTNHQSQLFNPPGNPAPAMVFVLTLYVASGLLMLLVLRRRAAR